MRAGLRIGLLLIASKTRKSIQYSALHADQTTKLSSYRCGVLIDKAKHSLRGGISMLVQHQQWFPTSTAPINATVNAAASYRASVATKPLSARMRHIAFVRQPLSSKRFCVR